MALLLAESITHTQEEKAIAKKKLNHERHEDHASTKRPRASGNDRLKKAKDIILAQKAQAKKQKVELRKTASRPHTPAESPIAPIKKKKGVSFA
ncbi:hypothetical protein DFH11DRAFT_1727238 [Phellopilus nigrolimitatus]|nr:hypothetical protein DFH11DRAFT_1727238 [Phellopilus nigrolimitatus]